MRYRPGLDLVLRELDFVVEGGKKVGIVGRTGAGKSSLMLALFRMVEPASGQILIDGVDIGRLSLRDLRSALAIIPQDPCLFSGTVKFNLDPEGTKTDSKLWEVLDCVKLADKIRSLDGNLEAVVSENGDSFSLGQRQLICMGRALLKESRVLLMDEATASVDIDTDRHIQELLRREFEGRSILTIAHRLNTIIDYDSIVVVDAGKVGEMGAPRTLLSDEDGLFSSLVRGTGAENEEKLRAAVGLPPVQKI
jgi:ATP-binding cassette subfamily C (CFTR/MRP) protein 1